MNHDSISISISIFQFISYVQKAIFIGSKNEVSSHPPIASPFVQVHSSHWAIGCYFSFSSGDAIVNLTLLKEKSYRGQESKHKKVIIEILQRTLETRLSFPKYDSFTTQIWLSWPFSSNSSLQNWENAGQTYCCNICGPGKSPYLRSKNSLRNVSWRDIATIWESGAHRTPVPGAGQLVTSALIRGIHCTPVAAREPAVSLHTAWLHQLSLDGQNL